MNKKNIITICITVFLAVSFSGCSKSIATKPVVNKAVITKIATKPVVKPKAIVKAIVKPATKPIVKVVTAKKLVAYKPVIKHSVKTVKRYIVSKKIVSTPKRPLYANGMRINWSKTYDPNLPMCNQPNIPDPWVLDQIAAAKKGGYLNKK